MCIVSVTLEVCAENVIVPWSLCVAKYLPIKGSLLVSPKTVLVREMNNYSNCEAKLTLNKQLKTLKK